MREIADFRIGQRFARRFLLPSVGVSLGELTRKVKVAVDDPLYVRIGQIYRELRERENAYFFAGWHIERHYTKEELQSGELFQLYLTSYFEPEGEFSGTVYDYSKACAHCGAGRRQVSELKLDLSKVPRGKDITMTIARDEVIVSERFAKLIQAHAITGVDLRPVVRARKPRSGAPIWYQLHVTARAVRVMPPTKIGVNPFEEDPEGKHRCALGHVSGLNLLSEVAVARSDWDGSDVAVTKELVGAFRGEGVIVPTPLVLISPRFRRLLEQEKIKGYKVEVAYLK
jgi:hypothetical protein